MNFQARNRFPFSALAVWALSIQVSPLAIGQAATSVPELIRFLTYQSDARRDKPMVFDCALVNADRDAATELAKRGPAAIREIEAALDSIERRSTPQAFIGAEWLLTAYSRIEGSNALPRLRQMASNPKLNSLKYAIDSSIALALGITSYVSASRTSLGGVGCGHWEPRNTVNQLVLAWLQDDRKELEASLGPDAKAVLDLMLAGRDWASMRKELWPGNTVESPAVGYQFEIQHPWAEPEETLQSVRRRETDAHPDENPELQILFKDKAGNDCGKHWIKLLQTQIVLTPTGAGGRIPNLPYLVNNADLANLLRIIASCAAQK